MTAPLLERELVVVTGKGGTGKTTISAALGLLGAQRGRRTIVVEVGGQERVPALLGASGPPGGDASDGETRLGELLWSVSVDPDEATIEWLRTVVGRAPARVLSSSSTFRYFAAAAPGAKELVTMVKLVDLLERYELVVMDAPATGHALAMLRSPKTFSTIAKVGPLASRSDLVQALLADPARSGYVAVAQGSEMAVTETLELEESLRRTLDRDLDAVIVNGVLGRRFTKEEIGQLAKLDGESRRPEDRAATKAAYAAYAKTRTEQAQIARLRRQRFADGAPAKVLTVPFQFTELDLAALGTIAARLGRGL